MTPENKPIVVITESSSGIGKACASRMLKAGWSGLAGVRKKEEDGKKLKSELGSDLLPSIVDVEHRGLMVVPRQQ